MIMLLLGIALILLGCSLGFWAAGVNPYLLIFISYILGSIGGVLISLGIIDIKGGY